MITKLGGRVYGDQAEAAGCLPPVRDPVHQGVQHGDPPIAYERDVAAQGCGWLLRHSVGEGKGAQVPHYVDRARGREHKIGRRVEKLLGFLVQFHVAVGRHPVERNCDDRRHLKH